MKRKQTLLQTVQRLKRDEVVRYASNIGVEINEEWDTAQMRKAYADYVLAHPKEILMMLPLEDIKILKPSEMDKPGEPRSLMNSHAAPAFVVYGMAEMEVVSSTVVEVTIPEDFFEAVLPHLDWALTDNDNMTRMDIEIMVEGLTNLFGIVTQQEVRKYLIKLCGNEIDDEKAKEVMDYVRQQSLLLYCMEWREHGDETAEEDVLFVSRQGWGDKSAMKQFISQRAAEIPGPREFTIEEVICSAVPLGGEMPNPYKDAFMGYLANVVGLDDVNCRQMCFMVWYAKLQTGMDEYADQMMEATFLSFGPAIAKRDLTERQLEEGMRQLTDYANNIPLWHLRGFTATDYPQEAYVPMRKAKLKGPLGKELKKMTSEMKWMSELLNSKMPDPQTAKLADDQTASQADGQTTGNPWDGMKIGRNDPCPCGSGLKYKKCHGKS